MPQREEFGHGQGQGAVHLQVLRHIGQARPAVASLHADLAGIGDLVDDAVQQGAFPGTIGADQNRAASWGMAAEMSCRIWRSPRRTSTWAMVMAAARSAGEGIFKDLAVVAHLLFKVVRRSILRSRCHGIQPDDGDARLGGQRFQGAGRELGLAYEQDGPLFPDMVNALQQPGGGGGLFFVFLQDIHDVQAGGTHHVGQGIVLQQYAGAGVGGTQGSKPFFRIQQVLLQGSRIGPNGRRLFRAGANQDFGHASGHLGGGGRRSEDMRVGIMRMVVPFLLMAGAAGKQGDSLTAVGLAGIRLGQRRRKGRFQPQTVHQDHVRSGDLGQIGRGRRIVMRSRWRRG